MIEFPVLGVQPLKKKTLQYSHHISLFLLLREMVTMSQSEISSLANGEAFSFCYAGIEQRLSKPRLDLISTRPFSLSAVIIISLSFSSQVPSLLSTPPHHVTVISSYYGYRALLRECDCRFVVLSLSCCISPSPPTFSLSSPFLSLSLPPMVAAELLI